MDWEREKELNPNLEPWIIYLILKSVAEVNKVPKELEKPVEDIIRAMENDDDGKVDEWGNDGL